MRRRLPVAGPGPVCGRRVAETERSVDVDVRRDDNAIEGLGEAIVDIVRRLEFVVWRLLITRV